MYLKHKIWGKGAVFFSGSWIFNRLSNEKLMQKYLYSPVISDGALPCTFTSTVRVIFYTGVCWEFEDITLEQLEMRIECF